MRKLLWLSLLIVAGCGGDSAETTRGKMLKPSRLFVHEVEHNVNGERPSVILSAWVPNGDELCIYTLRGKMKFVEDVPEGENIWIELYGRKHPQMVRWYDCTEQTVVHLHSPKVETEKPDVEGGGWNHGKGGRGAVNILDNPLEYYGIEKE